MRAGLPPQPLQQNYQIFSGKIKILILLFLNLRDQLVNNAPFESDWKDWEFHFLPFPISQQGSLWEWIRVGKGWQIPGYSRICQSYYVYPKQGSLPIYVAVYIPIHSQLIGYWGIFISIPLHRKKQNTLPILPTLLPSLCLSCEKSLLDFYLYSSTP